LRQRIDPSRIGAVAPAAGVDPALRSPDLERPALAEVAVPARPDRRAVPLARLHWDALRGQGAGVAAADGGRASGPGGGPRRDGGAQGQGPDHAAAEGDAAEHPPDPDEGRAGDADP